MSHELRVDTVADAAELWPDESLLTQLYYGPDLDLGPIHTYTSLSPRVRVRENMKSKV